MILDDIVAKTKIRIENKKREYSLHHIKQDAFYEYIDDSFPFEQALQKEGMSYILEVKKASPSKGDIVEQFDYLKIAKEYQEIGASAISVLTEPYFFKGKDQYLKDIVQVVTIPVLRKDFVVDEYMIYEAKLLGASAILLICSILDEITLTFYINLAHQLGMSCLVETHSSLEIKKAIRAGARIIGVNNRNLQTFAVDNEHSIQLRKVVPEDILFVSESGISTTQNIQALKKEHVDAVLIGETIMKAYDKQRVLQELDTEYDED